MLDQIAKIVFLGRAGAEQALEIRPLMAQIRAFGNIPRQVAPAFVGALRGAERAAVFIALGRAQLVQPLEPGLGRQRQRALLAALPGV